MSSPNRSRRQATLCIHAGTYQPVQELTQFGVTVSFARTSAESAASLRLETRVIYVESPSNPLLRLVDLAAIGQRGRDHGLLTIADSTFATPRGPELNIRPQPDQVAGGAGQAGALELVGESLQLPPWHFGRRFQRT